MRKLLSGAVAALLALGLLVTLVPSFHKGAGDVPRVSASLAAKARASFEQSMHNQVPTMQQPRLGSSNGPVTELADVNWSGFSDATTYQPVTNCSSPADGCQTISEVSASWTVPAVTCPSAPFQYEDQQMANWVGVDGFNDSTVEQTGSAGYCFEGAPYYYVWYELYPAATVVGGPASCVNDNVGCPQPGDHITASVTVRRVSPAEDAYQLTVTDLTDPANSLSATQYCATDVCFDNSANWIVERPAFEDTGITPFSDFGTTGFTDATLTANGRQSDIQGYQGGVYDIEAADSTYSYYLDCVGQTAAPGLLEVPVSLGAPNPCPPVQPSGGNAYGANNGQQRGGTQQGQGYPPGAGSSFNLTWDAAY